jgi:predicted permease
VGAALETAGRRHVQVGSVSANFFPMLGIQARMGRLFSSDDDNPKGVHTAVVSNELWKDAFGGDAGLLGKTVNIRGSRGPAEYVVIGILPPNFEFADYGHDPNPTPDVWVPASISNQPDDDYGLVAILKQGVSISDAERETQSILDATLDKGLRAVLGTPGARIRPRQQEQATDVRTSLYILLGSAGLLLVIACGNVANLLAGNALARSHEVAVRAAIGAGRWHLFRQLIIQSVVLSCAGGVLGTVMAYWMIHALVGISPVPIPRTAEIGIDTRVLAFAFAASTITGILFGLLPAFSATRADLDEVLKRTANTRVAPHSRAQGLVVVAEISLSFVLLITAGLLTQTLVRMWSESNRMHAEHILTVRADLFGTRFNPAQAEAFAATALDKLRALPGVESATGAAPAPFEGRGLEPVEIEGMPVPAGQPPLIDNRSVLTDYFSTLRLPILAGRSFTAAEISGAAHVVIVNKSMAQRFWSVETAINKRFRGVSPFSGGDAAPWLTIIGVCDDSRDLAGSERELLPLFYAPFASNSDLTFIVRSVDSPAPLTAAIRRELTNLNNNVNIGRTETMDALLWKDLAGERYRVILINLFAVVAAALALIGLYGVISRFVTNRTRELSIRMALGAKPQDVLIYVLRQSLVLTAAGIAIGIAAAGAVSRFIAALLFGVHATDAATYIGIAAGVFVVATIAAYLPARRASRCDPMAALRAE